MGILSKDILPRFRLEMPESPSLRVLSIFCALALAVCVLTLTFTLLLTPFPTYVFANCFVDTDHAAVSKEELIHLAQESLAYVNGDDSADLPLGSDDTISYTPEVMSHLDDVRALFTGVKIAAAISVAVLLLLFLIGLALHRKTNKVQLQNKTGSSKQFRNFVAVSMRLGLAVLVLMLGIFLLAALINFDFVFNFLHSLFFSSETWIFPADSLLICALPEAFWIAMAALWGALVVIVCVLLCIATKRISRSSC